MPAPELDLEALEAQATGILGNAPVAEATGAKLSRILLAVVADVLRLYASALEHRGPIDR